MRTSLGPWILGTVLLLSAATTVASPRPYPECTAQPTDGDVAAAKGAFQAGQASFNEADYERAITYWEDAYRRDCTAHALLLNLARAYELGGDKAQAVEALQTYLARKPESPQKDQINRRIEVLNQQLAKETKPAAPPPPTAPPPTEPKQAEPVTVESSPPSDAGSAKSEETARPWIGPLIIGGVGLIAAGTGVFVHNIGRSDEQDAEAQCPTRSCNNPAIEQQGNDGIAKQKLGVGLMIGGAVAIGGAAAWYLFGNTAPHQESPASPTKAAASPKSSAAAPAARNIVVFPEVGEGYAGLTLTGLF